MPPKSNPTHFLSIQLSHGQLSRNLGRFRREVTSANGLAIPDDAIRPPGTLHLTLGVMNLNAERLQRAIDLLNSLKPRVILQELRAAKNKSAPGNGSGQTGLSVALRGLNSMSPPSNTSVLYAPPTDPEGILYSYCEQLRKPFRESGLIEDDRPLLLHATIVNTIYVKGRGGVRRKERLMLDARDLMSQYDDYVWAEDMPITSLAICKMGARRIEGSDRDEAYEAVAQVRI